MIHMKRKLNRFIDFWLKLLISPVDFITITWNISLFNNFNKPSMVSAWLGIKPSENVTRRKRNWSRSRTPIRNCSTGKDSITRLSVIFEMWAFVAHSFVSRINRVFLGMQEKWGPAFTMGWARRRKRCRNETSFMIFCFVRRMLILCNALLYLWIADKSCS